jgi:hypothetical protein
MGGRRKMSDKPLRQFGQLQWHQSTNPKDNSIEVWADGCSNTLSVLRYDSLCWNSELRQASVTVRLNRATSPAELRERFPEMGKRMSDFFLKEFIRGKGKINNRFLASVYSVACNLKHSTVIRALSHSRNRQIKQARPGRRPVRQR